MKRLNVWQMLTVVAAGAVTASCVADGETIFIIQNQIPKRAAAGEACDPGAAAGSMFRSHGFLDTTSPAGYEMYPVVESRAESFGGDDTKRTIQVEGAEIRLTSEPAGLINTSVTRRFGGPISPGGQTTFQLSAMSPDEVRDVNAGLADGERALVLVDLKIFGEIAGGSVSSTDFTYPIEVCKGCLIADLGDCAALPAGLVVNPGGECNPFQDVAVDCCSSNGFTFCPAPSTATP